MDNHQYVDVNQSYQMSPSTQLDRVIDQLMFLIYINDITTLTLNSSSIQFFPDDCLLYRTIHSPHDFTQLYMMRFLITDSSPWSCNWEMQLAMCIVCRGDM